MVDAMYSTSLPTVCKLKKHRRNIGRELLELNMTFGQELVVLHTSTTSMFGKISVYAWRLCGNLNKEHSKHWAKF